MGRDRDRQSRFGPPNNYKSSNLAPLMSLKTGMARSYEESVFSTQNLGSAMSANYKTPEQLAFDNEFKKWEKSFEDWKRAYANHPDRNAYREYENKFLDVRAKLLEKRKQIYCEERGGPSNNFDNLLFAADAMANSILSKFGEPQRDFRDDDQYRGGYSRDNRDDRFGNSGSYPLRDAGRSERGFGANERSFGGSSSFGRNDRSSGGNDRSFGGSSSFGRNDRSSGGNDRRGGRDDGKREGRDRRGLGFASDRRDNRGGGMRGGRNDRSGGGGRGNDRFDRQIKKPTQEQINRDLARRDVYPNTRWVLMTRDGRPPLVGKRAKKKNTKIKTVIEKKRAIAAGEIPLEELPFSEKVDKMFEMAQNAELPKLLPGSAKRRLNNIKKKRDEDLTADERKFVAYCDFVSVKRQKYFDEKKKREAEEEALKKGENTTVVQEQAPMEQEPSHS